MGIFRFLLCVPERKTLVAFCRTLFSLPLFFSRPFIVRLLFIFFITNEQSVTKKDAVFIKISIKSVK